MIDRADIMIVPLGSIVAGATSLAHVSFPYAVRITRLFATPSIVEAVHATQTLEVSLTNKGVAGAGSTVIATLSNGTAAQSATRKNAAWAAAVQNVFDFEARPTLAADAAGNVAEELVANSVLEVKAVKGAGTATGLVSVGIEYKRSD
jgi:hypothetical protein